MVHLANYNDPGVPPSYFIPTLTFRMDTRRVSQKCFSILNNVYTIWKGLSLLTVALDLRSFSSSFRLTDLVLS